MTDVSDITEGSTSSSLLVRVKSHDPVAWQRMVSLYGPLVYEWCRQSRLQAADAADVGQEVFQVVARKIHEFRRELAGDTFRGWLRSITRFKILGFFEAHGDQGSAAGGSDALRQLQQAPDDIWSEVDDQQTGDSERVLLCRRAMELIQPEFEPRTWQAFWQVTVEDQSPGDVAAQLGMSVNSVYLAKSRILSRLRTEFVDLIEIDLE